MRTIFFTFILTSAALYADVVIPETFFQKKIDLEPQEDEIVAIERVQKTLEEQQQALCKIKTLIIELRRNQDLFLKEGASKLYARYILDGAEEILSLARTHHLEHLFSSDFMEDLAVYTQIGKKSG